MQQPPLYVRMPDVDARDDAPKISASGWVVIVAAAVALVTFMVLFRIHDQHAFHGDRAGTPEFAQCLSDQLRNAGNGGIYDSDACMPVMPWYAAHPFWYALIVGAAVFVIGRIALFMVRMERSRGY